MSIIITAILSAVGGALVTLIVTLATGLKGFIKAMIMATKATTHNELFGLCRSILDRGQITEEELENLNQLYEAYHALGMNGTGEELYNRCKQLPIMVLM